MVVRIWAQIWKWMILRTRICDWHFGGEARLKGEGWGCKVGGNVFYLGAFHLKPQLIGWLRRKDSNWKRLRGWVNYRLLNLGSNWSLLMQFGWPFQKDLERRIATGIFWLVFFLFALNEMHYSQQSSLVDQWTSASLSKEFCSMFGTEIWKKINRNTFLILIKGICWDFGFLFFHFVVFCQKIENYCRFIRIVLPLSILMTWEYE